MRAEKWNKILDLIWRVTPALKMLYNTHHYSLQSEQKIKRQSLVARVKQAIYSVDLEKFVLYSFLPISVMLITPLCLNHWGNQTTNPIKERCL